MQLKKKQEIKDYDDFYKKTHLENKISQTRKPTIADTKRYPAGMIEENQCLWLAFDNFATEKELSRYLNIYKHSLNSSSLIHPLEMRFRNGHSQ